MMNNRTFYNEVLIEHNLHPSHKHALECATCSKDGQNPTCGDEITLNLRVENGKIADGSFTGNGCAISQASADMMLDLVIGKTEEEARKYIDLFLKMIRGEATEEEIEELEDAGALKDVSHMPTRAKCATLAWHTLLNIVGEKGA